MSDEASPTAAAGDAPQPPANAIESDPADAPATQAVLVADPESDGGGDGGFGTPIATDFPTAPTKGGLTAALVAIGSGLLGAAVVISAYRARQHDGSELDTSTYLVGIIATVALLGLALVAAVVVHRKAGGQARGDLVTWPGVVGVVATAPMIMVGLGPNHDGKGVAYLVGGVITCLALIGYVVARRAAFVVVAIAGLGVLYARGFDDVLGGSFKHDNQIVVVAGAVTAFVVVITILGWFLPSRTVTGVTVGVFGVVGVAGSMAALLLERMLAGLLGSFASFLPGLGSGLASGKGGLGIAGGLPKMSSNPADYTGEVAWVIVFVAILTVLWALGALISDHSGFKVLAVVLPAVAIPLGLAVIAVQHPTWWGAGLGAGGAVLVLLALFLARGKANKVLGM